ncbi:MAG: hypothetical protein V3V08_13900 [Nannocystaceae bacterium]
MIGALLSATTLLGGLTSSMPPAEQWEVSARAAAGSGVSVSGTGREVLKRRSPLTLNLGVGFRHPQWSWLELCPGIQLEMQGKASFAFRPVLRAYLPTRRPTVHGLVGAPLYVFPFTLHGVEVGFGVAYPLAHHVALTAEASATAFVGGSDLMTGSGLTKLDVAGGIRVSF